MNVVRSLLLLLVLVATTLTLLLAGATGMGALLHRLIPTIGLGTAVLIGVVALSVSVHFVLGIFAQVHSVRQELDEAELEQLLDVVHRSSRKRRDRR
jgi:TRAP-type C4-dicarboxylate transport system permease small subunit